MSRTLDGVKIADPEKPGELCEYYAFGSRFFSSVDHTGKRRTWTTADGGMYELSSDGKLWNDLPPSSEPFGPLVDQQLLRNDTGDFMDDYVLGHGFLGEDEVGGIEGLQFASNLLTIAHLFGLEQAKRILVANADVFDATKEEKQITADIMSSHQEKDVACEDDPENDDLFLDVLDAKRKRIDYEKKFEEAQKDAEEAQEKLEAVLQKRQKVKN